MMGDQYENLNSFFSLKESSGDLASAANLIKSDSKVSLKEALDEHEHSPLVLHI